MTKQTIENDEERYERIRKEREERYKEEARWYQLNYRSYMQINVTAKILKEKRSQMTVGAFESMEQNFKEFIDKEVVKMAEEYLNVVAKTKFPHCEIKVTDNTR